jgi:hypothetical protein
MHVVVIRQIMTPDIDKFGRSKRKTQHTFRILCGSQNRIFDMPCSKRQFITIIEFLPGERSANV